MLTGKASPLGNVSTAQTVHMWHRRHGDFPAPVVELSMGYLWSWPDVEELSLIHI